MTDAYRRLSQTLPARRPPGPGSFPTDPRKAKAWVDGLPRANQVATFRHLGEALGALSTTSLEGAQRLAVMEVLRGPVMEACTVLTQQVQGGSIPLPPAKARAFEQLVEFESALAMAYRIAAVEYCAPTGSVPFMRGGSVAQALERAAYHTSRSLMHAYFLYRQPPEGLWSALHALFLYARANKLEEKSYEEGVEKRAVSVRSVYLQAMLIALSNPFRFSQKEQVDLWRSCGELAAGLDLHDSLCAEDLFGIPLDSDEGPGYIPAERARGGDALLWIDLARLRSAVEAALESATGPLCVVRIKGIRPVEVTADMLRRLRGGWGRSASRRNQRLSAGHVLHTALGLSGVHFYLSGLVDFDTFLRQAGVGDVVGDQDRALWAHATVDAGRMPLQNAEVLDQSLGGYQLRWASEENVKARVGELIGLGVGSDVAERQWMLGIVRWLRYAQDGSVDAGIELISRRARPVVVRELGAVDGGRPPQRGVEYVPLRDADGDSLYLAVPGAQEPPSSRCEILRVPDPDDIESPVELSVALGKPDLLESPGDYQLIQTRRQAA